MRARLLRALAAAALLVTVVQGCAYYNTFYLAKRYYGRSLNDVPYAVDKADLSGQPQFNRSIDLSQKLIQQYPKSKWVDDANLLWAKSLIGNDDPREAIRMLEEFLDKYPKSNLRSEARFYLGVAQARARKYERALDALGKFFDESPKKSLEPYAYLERSRALYSLERYAEAADAAGMVVNKYKKSELATRARLARADALFAQKSYDKAREDYHFLGTHSLNDEDRLTFLLNEADCLQGARKYDEALNLLHDAMGHEREPLAPDTTGGKQAVGPSTPEQQHYGRLQMRIGTVHLAAGNLDQALASYHRVLADYPRTTLAAEAQYRIGYAYETAGDDFDRARNEYNKVKDISGGTSFADQAATRVASLDQLVQFRSATGDSVQQAAEKAFLRAEQYLFELDNPQRAVEEYEKIAQDYSGTPYAAKAIMAQGWVMGRRLNRKSSADSLFWIVVREHPGTEAQLASRDYLEADGATVPENLIRLPEPVVTHADSVTADSLLRADMRADSLHAAAVADSARLANDSTRVAARDSLHALGDSLTKPPVGPNTLGAPQPTLGSPSTNGSTQLGQPHVGAVGLAPIVVPDSAATHPARTDTTHHAKPDSTRKSPAVPPDTTHRTHP